MPFKREDITKTTYYLVRFDKNGEERKDDEHCQSGLLSDAIAEQIKEGITDVFIMSHGWMTDEPRAIAQYESWIRAMLDEDCSDDVAKIKAKRKDFKSIVVGIHWPSLPFGDEKPVDWGLLGAKAAEKSSKNIINKFSERISDSDKAAGILGKLCKWTFARNGVARPDERELITAWETLESESGLEGKGLKGDPGSDRNLLNGSELLAEAKRREGKDLSNEAEAEGKDQSESGCECKIVKQKWDLFDTLFAGPRLLSFYKKKKLALTVGEKGASELLRKLQSVAPAETRFHLVGHSFGSIVVSAAIKGPKTNSLPLRPVNSLVLLQGALSHWSFCKDEEIFEGGEGYFYCLNNEGYLSGPVLSTWSRCDRACGDWYPLAAFAKGEYAIAEDEDQPNFYGSVGRWGIRGKTISKVIGEKLYPCDKAYSFKPSFLYSFDGTDYIRSGDAFSGGHSDLAHPEVAHLVWQAAFWSKEGD